MTPEEEVEEGLTKWWHFYQSRNPVIPPPACARDIGIGVPDELYSDQDEGLENCPLCVAWFNQETA